MKKSSYKVITKLEMLTCSAGKIIKWLNFLLTNVVKFLLVLPFQILWVRNLWLLYCKDSTKNYLFLTDHAGDTFIVLGLLESYLRNYQPNFVLIVKDNFQKLVNYFPEIKMYSNIWYNKKFWGLSWEKLAKSTETIIYWPKKDKVYGFGCPILVYKNLKLVGFKYKYVKKYVAETRNDRSSRRMDKYLSYSIGLPQEMSLARICVPESYKAKAENYMKEYGLIAGCTVILAPYSNSDRHRSYSVDNIQMFEKIASILKKKGFLVCTNVDSANREPIRGTKPISPPLEILIPLCKLCGYVITYRSGFADIAAQSGAKLFVFYPEFEFLGVNYYNYTSVKAIHQNSGIIEVVGNREEFVRVVDEMVLHGD